MVDTKSNARVEVRQLLSIIDAHTAVIRMGHDLNAIMALVTDRATDIVPAADGAVIEMVEGDEMVYRAVSGTASELLGLRLKRAGSLSGLCVSRVVTLYCKDADSDPRVDLDEIRSIGIGSMVVTPLNSDGNTFGVMKICASTPHAFSPSDIRIVELLAAGIAAALGNAIKYTGDELIRKATTDPLTGMANRTLLFERLRAAIADAMKSGDALHLLLIDMDGLKRINDEHGHRVGDAAIRETAHRIAGEVRQSDTVARLGGDEFAVLLYLAATEARVHTIVERLLERCNRPFRFEGRQYAIGASVGTATYVADSESSGPLGRQAELLLDEADRAMYRNKRARRKDRS